ncbi:Uncharacterised protein [Candidatus Gugararchaeum adminiculabundum]|nr:Uncharacterised protein [Candidatus Gugararchaeum adminiculabundum]
MKVVTRENRAPASADFTKIPPLPSHLRDKPLPYQLIFDQRGFLAIRPKDIDKMNGHSSIFTEIMPLTREELAQARQSWQKLLLTIEHDHPELAAYISKLLDAKVPLHNTHKELGSDSLSIVLELKEFIHVGKFLLANTQPDWEAITQDVHFGHSPEKEIIHGGANQNYNPDAIANPRKMHPGKPRPLAGISDLWKRIYQEQRYKGYGLHALILNYEQLVANLSDQMKPQPSKKAADGDPKDWASKYAGNLGHIAADIIIPHHAVGKFVGWEWVSPDPASHGALELLFAKKRNKPSLATTPKYIYGGSQGIAQRYEQEAKFSHDKYTQKKQEMEKIKPKSKSRKTLETAFIAAKSFIKNSALSLYNLVTGNGNGTSVLANVFWDVVQSKNIYSRDEMKQMYQRAVQLQADLYYTAVINAKIEAGILAKPPPDPIPFISKVKPLLEPKRQSA